MDVRQLLTDLYSRVDEHVHEALDDLGNDALTWQPAPGANHIAWQVWHLTRVEDHHVSELLDEPQLFVGGGWAERLGMAADPDNTGYGHTPEQVTALSVPDAATLLGYYEAVAARTSEYLGGLSEDDLDHVVDRRWNPPVTLGVRLISVADDAIQHAGQACYVRGLT